MPSTFPEVAALAGVGPAPSAAVRRATLRATLQLRVRERSPLVLPGVTDALGARLVERAGFQAAYLTGAGLANAQYGLPDIGLIGAREVEEHVARLSAGSRLPLVVDADTGYGGPLSAMRTVRLLERAGAAALQLEDQEMPKRCGHFDAHSLIPAAHMQTKIAAARTAREDENLLIIARTDARSAEGIDEALRRATAYAAAGADAIFVEAPRTVEELERVGRELAGIPLVVNVVEGGKTPELPLAQYAELGFSLVLFANFLMRAMLRAGREALAHLAAHGETATYADRIAGWEERQELFNLPQFSAAERFYDQPWEGVTGGDEA